MAQAITIKIGALGDGPIFPEHRDAQDATILGFAILEQGMQSGKTSCGFFFESQGKKYFAQLSNDMMQSLASAACGADERFRDKIKGN